MDNFIRLSQNSHTQHGNSQRAGNTPPDITQLQNGLQFLNNQFKLFTEGKGIKRPAEEKPLEKKFKQEKIKCQLCNSQLANVSTLMRHYIKMHGEKNPEKFIGATCSSTDDIDLSQSLTGSEECTHCGLVFNSKVNLYSHVKVAHKNVEVSQNNNILRPTQVNQLNDTQYHECQECCCYFKDKAKFDDHMIKIHKRSEIKCPICNGDVLFKEIDNHFKTDHPEVGREEKIEKKTVRKDIVVKVLCSKVGKVVRAFKCAKCNEIFGNNAKARKHAKTHNKTVKGAIVQRDKKRIAVNLKEVKAELRNNKVHASKCNCDVQGKRINDDPVIYRCKNCKVSTGTYDAAVTHSQNHIIDCNYEFFTKTCEICDLKFELVCYENHLDLHALNKELHRESFTYVDYDFTALLNKDWYEYFKKEDLPNTQIKDEMSKSIYYFTRSIKMRSISCLSPNTFSDHNLYKCGLCNNFVDPKSVVNHVQNYETCLKINVSHPCSVCIRPFNSRRAKDNHEKIHKKDTGECFKTIIFNNVRDKDHNQILLKASVEGIKNVAVIYKCRCALCFVSEESAIEHMKACSPDINIIKEICQKCNNIFDIRELVKHCYVHMNEGVNSIEVKEMAFPLKQESNDNQGDKPLYRIIQTTDVDNHDAVVDILLILDSDDEQDEENEAEDDRVPSGDEEISMATDSDDEEARVRNDVQENIGEEMRNAEVIIEGTDQNKSQSVNIEAQEQRNNFANEKVTQASHVPNAAEPEIDKIPEDVSRNSNACPNVVSDLFVSPQNIQNDSENPPMLNVISPVINYENPVSLNEDPIECRSTDNDVSLTDDEEPQNLTQINACNSTITCETEYNMATLRLKCVNSRFLLSSSGLMDTPIHNVPENNTTANELNTIVDIKTEFGCELNNTSTPIKSLLDPRDFSSICTRPSLRRGYSADVGSSGQPESVPIKAEPVAFVDDLIDLLTDDEDVPEQFQNSSHDYDLQQSGAESIPFIVPKREVDSVESDNYVAETEGIITDDENNVSADSPNDTLIASNIDRQESNNFNTENEEEANNEVPTKTFIKQSKEGRNERHDDNYGNKDLEMQLRNFLAMIYSRPLTNIHRPNIINIPMKKQSEVMNKTAQNISNDTSVNSDNTFDIDADVTNENKENNTKKREDANIKKHVTRITMNLDETPEFSEEIVTESATLHQNSIIDNTYEDNEQEISSYADCVMESVLREKEIDGEIHNEMTSKDDSGSVLNVNLRPQKNTLEDVTVESDNSDSKDSNANDNANIHNNNFKENVPVTKNLSAKDTYDKCCIS